MSTAYMGDALLNLDPDACVSASELVRHFGTWQEKAIAQPVFVMRRGRPSLVLTSFDLMRRLCLDDGEAAPAPLDTLLLDSMREAVLTIDATGGIQHANRAARILFAATEHGLVDKPLDRLLGAAIARFLIDQAARSRRAGITEQCELAVGDRHFSVVVAPRPDGALLILQDDTHDAEAGRSCAMLDALQAAVGTMGELATVRLNLRGYVEPPSNGLAAMTGLDAGLLPSVRFVTLFDLAARVALGEAIEAVMRAGTPQRISARLIRNHAAPLPVRVALAPERSRIAIDAVTAIIMRECVDP